MFRVFGLVSLRKRHYCALGLAAPAGRIWIIVAVIEPSEFGVPVTSTFFPVVSDDTGTLCISCT